MSRKSKFSRFVGTASDYIITPPSKDKKKKKEQDAGTSCAVTLISRVEIEYMDSVRLSIASNGVCGLYGLAFADDAVV
jgi:hypothetical protein